MYPSLAAAISAAEEISTQGLPSGICPLVFVFTGSGDGMLKFSELMNFYDAAPSANLNIIQFVFKFFETIFNLLINLFLTS